MVFFTFFVSLNQLSGFTIKYSIRLKWIKRCPIPESCTISIFWLLLNLYNIIVTRFRLIKHNCRHLLPKIYINPNDFLLEPCHSGKIKVSLRKITLTFGLSSNVAQQIGKKWKSAWLILILEKYYWFNLEPSWCWKLVQKKGPLFSILVRSTQRCKPLSYVI